MKILGKLALAAVPGGDTARKRAPSPKTEALPRRRVYAGTGERRLPVCESVVREGRRHRGHREHRSEDKPDKESRSQHHHLPTFADVSVKSGITSDLSRATPRRARRIWPQTFGC